MIQCEQAFAMVVAAAFANKRERLLLSNQMH